MISIKNLKPKNIIIRMPNWIGDLVMATPILTDLRRAYPEASITAMCRLPGAELLFEDPNIDELFSFRKESIFRRREERRNLVEKLRKGKYDLGILLTNSFSSAWWFWQGKIPIRLGYSLHWRRLFLTDPVPVQQAVGQEHQVIAYKRILEPLGIPISETAPRLFLNEKEILEARALLAQRGVRKGRIVGINPGAAYGSAKCWLPERFREVTRKLLDESDLYIVYFGDSSMLGLVKEICQDFPSRVINLAGLTSLRELAALLSLCDVVLTNDSGPMHIADALGVPVVALFGSTDETKTGPYNQGKVIRKAVSCSPCFKRTCPIDFRCMKGIEVDEVLSELFRVVRASDV